MTNTSDPGAGHRGRLDVILKMVTLASVLCGGVFTAVQYLEAKSLQRVERTVEYFRQYESGDIGKARHELAASLNRYQPQFDQISAAGVTPSDRDSMMATIFINDTGVGENFDLVADFFQGARICVDTKLCDGDIARNYFAHSDASDLWRLGAPYVQYRRANNPSYADAYESFVRAQLGAGAPATAARTLPTSEGAPIVGGPSSREVRRGVSVRGGPPPREDAAAPSNGATHVARPGVTVPAPRDADASSH